MTHLLHDSTAGRLSLLSALTLLLGVPAPRAAAQDVPAVTQHTEAVAAAPPEEDHETTWNISAGANLSTGNTRARNVNAGTQLYVLRGSHALTLQSAFNYGQADTDGAGPDDYQLTTRNLNSRVRYDAFLTANDALFVAVAHRWDSLAGLQTRLQLQAGYLRNLVKNDNTRAWIEAGYDFTFDNRQNSPGRRVICSEDDVTNMVGGCTRVVRNFQNIHALRLFYGLTHKFSDDVRVATGLEFLINMNELAGGEAGAFEDIRVNWETALNARLIERLALEVKFRLQYDRVPAATQEVDTNTLISVIYTLL